MWVSAAPWVNRSAFVQYDVERGLPWSVHPSHARPPRTVCGDLYVGVNSLALSGSGGLYVAGSAAMPPATSPCTWDGYELRVQR
jgi:hypothetical protein